MVIGGVSLCRALLGPRSRGLFLLCGTVAASLWVEVTADLLNIPLHAHATQRHHDDCACVRLIVAQACRSHCRHHVFQMLGVLIASHSAFTLVFPAGIMRRRTVFSPLTVDASPSFCVRAGALPFSRFVRRSRRGLVASVGACGWLAAGGIPLTTLVLWYLCHIGVGAVAFW